MLRTFFPSHRARDSTLRWDLDLFASHAFCTISRGADGLVWLTRLQNNPTKPMTTATIDDDGDDNCQRRRRTVTIDDGERRRRRRPTPMADDDDDDDFSSHSRTHVLARTCRRGYFRWCFVLSYTQRGFWGYRCVRKKRLSTRSCVRRPPLDPPVQCWGLCFLGCCVGAKKTLVRVNFLADPKIDQH